MEEQDISQRVLKYHQEHVSRMLTWVGVEEERAVYLCDYNNVVRDLANPSPDEWALARAAMLHMTHAEDLRFEHNRWLGQQIFGSFEREAQDQLYDLVLETWRDRPDPRFDPQEMFPNHRMTAREATYYYSRAALAVLASKEDPDRAIVLLEDLKTIFAPQVRYRLPGEDHAMYPDWVLGRLPGLYERVGRYEDALNITPVSFDLFGSNIASCDVAVRRLDGWLDQLSESGGVSEVERCLDVIYEWMDKASDVDDEERDHIGECPTATRQFWAWYYGSALGRLLVARPSLEASLLDEAEAGEWENCWHVAGVLFETLPESWEEYRQRALKFYYSSDIEYHRQGSVPRNGTQPPHLSAQSDLYWAMRVGFADAHADNAGERRASLAGIAGSLERIETSTSGTAQRVLRTERNTDKLLEDLNDRLPPNHEYWYGKLLEELPGLMSGLPGATVDHLIEASRHKFLKEWDHCKVSLCKSVESLFRRILVPRIQAIPESGKLNLALPRGKQSPRRRSSEEWDEIPMSGWVHILRTATEKDINSALRSTLPQAFPDIDLDAVVNLNVELATIARLRGGSAHDSGTASDRKASDAEELWDLVVGNDGGGFLAKFHSALGLTKDGQAS